MKRISSLSDLLMEELADLLNAENQLLEALPKMADASRSGALKTALQECVEITKDHVKRLHDIFSDIGHDPQDVTCDDIKGLIAESEDALNKAEKGPASDMAIISMAQRLQQYEISRYKTVREHATDLGHTMMVEVLTKTINEERAMNFYFNELVQGMINIQAIDPSTNAKSGGGFYIPEGRLRMGGIKKKCKNADVSRFISEGNPNTQEPKGNP